VDIRTRPALVTTTPFIAIATTTTLAPPAAVATTTTASLSSVHTLFRLFTYLFKGMIAVAAQSITSIPNISAQRGLSVAFVPHAYSVRRIWMSFGRYTWRFNDAFNCVRCKSLSLCGKGKFEGSTSKAGLEVRTHSWLNANVVYVTERRRCAVYVSRRVTSAL